MKTVQENVSSADWSLAIEKVLNQESLGQAVATELFGEALTGEAEDIQIAGLLVALRARGYEPQELAGFAQAMQKVALAIKTPSGCIDIVGTGGSAVGKVGALNVSTMAAFVVAAYGVPVLKHGNRKVSSTSGSFDFLEAAGFSITDDSKKLEQQLAEVGLGFAFARIFHPAMKHVANVRKALGIPTVFNLLGPLCNPGRVRRLVLGAATEEAAELLAQTASMLDFDRVLVVHGTEGVDEVCLTDDTLVLDVQGSNINKSVISPADLGLAQQSETVVGGDALRNKQIFESICSNELSSARDMVVANAAAGFVVAGVCEDMASGVAVANNTIADGKLNRLVSELKSQK